MNDSPTHVVDTHQHLWVRTEREYDWISPDFGVLYNDFRQDDVMDDIHGAGVTNTVLVQAADTYEDTFYMLSVARDYPQICGVVGWVPFDRTAEAHEALELFQQVSLIKGIRNLTHNYPDPRWILQPQCLDTLGLLAPRGFSLDMVSVNSEHNQAIIELADALPDLPIVIDHMAKPNIAGKTWEPWASEMTALAARPNVFVKHSGLNTASGEGWSASDWQPYVDHCLEQFGPQRMMLGSDWPVSLLNGDYRGVWAAQMDTLTALSAEDRAQVTWKTANSFYRLGLS